MRLSLALAAAILALINLAAALAQAPAPRPHNGVLFIADSDGAAFYAIGTNDTKGDSKAAIKVMDNHLEAGAQTRAPSSIWLSGSHSRTQSTGGVDCVEIP